MIVYTIFAGRRENLEIQCVYIDKLLNDNLIDEVHLWDFSRKHSDGEYLLEISQKTKYKLMHVENKKSWKEYYEYYEKYTDGIVIKSDDDIVFIDVNAFADFISFVKSNDYLLYFPSIVNNGVCAYWQQFHGFIPKTLDIYFHEQYCGSLWKNTRGKATRLHQYFIDNWREFCKLHRESKHVVEHKQGHRISINWFACKCDGNTNVYTELLKHTNDNGILDDEKHITVTVPPIVDKNISIYMNMVVAHLSFFSQITKYMPIDLLRDGYRNISKM